MADHEIKRLILRLKNLITTTESVISSFSEEEMNYQSPDMYKHSKKEILGNLITSAMMNQVRFNTVLSDKNPTILTPIQYNTEISHLRYNKQCSLQLIKLWVSLNEQIIYTLEDIPAPDLAHKIIDSTKQEEITFFWIIKDYINWLENKLSILNKPQTLGKNQVFDKISLYEIEKKLAKQSALPFIKIFEKENFILEYYKPNGIDLQTPHKQDEIYIIISGTGKFLKGNELFDFKAQDVFFVEAGQHHKFIDFTDNFSTWVVFF